MKKNPKITPKIKELKDKVSELTAGWQRTQADFANFKKQVALDQLKLVKNANAELVLDILPILDNFQLAAKHLPKNLQSDNWAQGVQQIEKQFEVVLESAGLVRIDALGKMFDPDFHEAIEEIKSDQKEGIIVEEVLSGYKLNDIVLRPAKVKVAK